MLHPNSGAMCRRSSIVMEQTVNSAKQLEQTKKQSLPLPRRPRSLHRQRLLPHLHLLSHRLQPVRVILQRIIRNVHIGSRLERAISQRVLHLTSHSHAHLKVLDELQLVTHPPQRAVLRVLVLGGVVHDIVARRRQKVVLCHLLLHLPLLHLLFRSTLQLLLERSQRLQCLFSTHPHDPHVFGPLSRDLVLVPLLLSLVLRAT
mgnify:CR=1 FL=1